MKMRLSNLWFVVVYYYVAVEQATGLSVFQRTWKAIRKPAAIIYSRTNLVVSLSASSSSHLCSDSTNLVGVPRLETLQEIVSKWGVPGSFGCTLGNGDMVRATQFQEALHPYLRPISQSQTTGNYICAFQRTMGALDDGISSPIVESGENFPGMRLLALNSEHLMRRIVCEADANEHPLVNDLLSLYNDGLNGSPAYERGSVTKLGYGLDKYILLRVGPFPDLYESLSLQHLAKGDESSALIAAETSNGKFSGFGSAYASYARLLSKLPSRTEESRDAARVCLRLPISTVGMTLEDMKDVAILAGFAEANDPTSVAMHQLQLVYDKMRRSEQQERSSHSYDSMPTKEQLAIQDASYLLDKVAMSGGHWGPIRQELAEIYLNAGCSEMAAFVNPT